jgi:hypothetical protein
VGSSNIPVTDDTPQTIDADFFVLREIGMLSAIAPITVPTVPANHSENSAFDRAALAYEYIGSKCCVWPGTNELCISIAVLIQTLLVRSYS